MGYIIQTSNGVTIDKLLPGVKKNIFLRDYTTFRIGGRARYFFIAKTKSELISAVIAAKRTKLPFFILGGGSNLLVVDEGYKGLVIKIQNSKFKILNSKIYTEAGAPLSLIVNASVNKSLTGLEWAAGIPGTVGGAVFGNAGWPNNKKNISSVIESVEVLETKPKLKIKNYSAEGDIPSVARYKLKDCKFGYRDSIFKRRKNLVILSVFLKLKKGKKEKIKKEISEIFKKRKEKIPIDFSAGSVFKNPTGFSAGQLIEKCGLKGEKIGNVKISKKHANFIINLGKGKAKDVKKLINLIKKKVKNKFKINLKEEIQIL